jgi:hypothetical protein
VRRGRRVAVNQWCMVGMGVIWVVELFDGMEWVGF